MTTHNAGRVAGERIVDLVQALRGLKTGLVHRGMTTVGGTVGAPAVRALMRVEAELLIADANAGADGAIPDRTYDQRRHDAFALLLERIAANLPSSAEA